MRRPLPHRPYARVAYASIAPACSALRAQVMMLIDAAAGAEAAAPTAMDIADQDGDAPATDEATEGAAA